MSCFGVGPGAAGGTDMHVSDQPGACADVATAVTHDHSGDCKKPFCFFLVSVFPALRPTMSTLPSGLGRLESFVMLTAVSLCCSSCVRVELQTHAGCTPSFGRVLMLSGWRKYIKLLAIARISFTDCIS